MAVPAIWRPPKFTGTQTLRSPGRGLLAGLLGGPGQRTTLALGRDQRNALLGRGGAPQAPANPYAGILADYMNQMRADFGAQASAEKGDAINRIRQYIISYGGSPNFDQFGGLGKDAQGFLKEALDPRTVALAKKAEEEGVSSHARMSRANEIANRRIPSQLAARGILRSGQTGADLAEQALTYKQQGYDMLNELMGGVTGTVRGYQEAERERQRQLAQMEMEAAFQAAQDWGDSYFDQGPTDVDVPNLQGTPTKKPGRPPKPGPNYVWNGKRWVRKQTGGRGRGAGGGGGTPKVM